MLESVLGEIEIDKAVYDKLEDTAKASSPGMKYKHYSPKADVVLVRGSFDNFKKYVENIKEENIAAVVFDGEDKLLNVKALTYGKEDDSFSQARNIFSVLREIDKTETVRVFVRYPKRQGMGLAVYNRLIRAAAFEVIEI